MVKIEKQTAESVTLTVDTKDKDFHASKSGKTKVTGTGGFVMLGNGLKLSLNVTKPSAQSERAWARDKQKVTRLLAQLFYSFIFYKSYKTIMRGGENYGKKS